MEELEGQSEHGRMSLQTSLAAPLGVKHVEPGTDTLEIETLGRHWMKNMRATDADEFVRSVRQLC